MPDVSSVIIENGNRYAFMEWNTRWNKSKGPDVASDQSGNKFMLVTVMGIVQFDLDDTDSITAFSRTMRAAVDHLNEVKEEYDKVLAQSSLGKDKRSDD